ncbi:unnamed protein product [Nezara viridula]|uniref:Uncharacterized protein n=1 Tax=Nezara viridula TaxID=85310 RepID=A0A9P0E790_NEZVI|nr:unnamed protein product [Nezara viridula]
MTSSSVPATTPLLPSPCPLWNEHSKPEVVVTPRARLLPSLLLLSPLLPLALALLLQAPLCNREFNNSLSGRRNCLYGCRRGGFCRSKNK